MAELGSTRADMGATQVLKVVQEKPMSVDEILEIVYKANREKGYVLSKDYWGKGLMTEAVTEVIRYLFEDEFSKAADLMYETKGKVIVTGVGKSGHVGAKIAATLASLGTQSFFRLKTVILSHLSF